MAKFRRTNPLASASQRTQACRKFSICFDTREQAKTAPTPGDLWPMFKLRKRNLRPQDPITKKTGILRPKHYFPRSKENLFGCEQWRRVIPSLAKRQPNEFFKPARSDCTEPRAKEGFEGSRNNWQGDCSKSKVRWKPERERRGRTGCPRKQVNWGK